MKNFLSALWGMCAGLTFIDVVIADGPLLCCMAADHRPHAFRVHKHTLFLIFMAPLQKTLSLVFYRRPI